MKSEFIESELELYVQRLLMHEFYSTGQVFRMEKISPFNEKLKGYDAKIIGVSSFYCQFKTSDFLTQGNAFKNRLKFCDAVGYPKIPFYSFGLRAPAAADTNRPQLWQHNVLHSLWKKNKNNVAYVAPMFHTRLELNLHEPIQGNPICCSCCIFADRFRCKELLYNERRQKLVSINNRKINCFLPSFHGLISIPPHESVNKFNHKYCYNTPSDISFHSEPEPVEGGRLFSDSLEQFIRESVNTQEHLPANKMQISEIQNLIGLDESEFDKALLKTFLRYGIRQTLGSDINSMSNMNSIDSFNELNWLHQRVVFASSLQAFFGITTLGLFEYEN